MISGTCSHLREALTPHETTIQRLRWSEISSRLPYIITQFQAKSLGKDVQSGVERTTRDAIV